MFNKNKINKHFFSASPWMPSPKYQALRNKSIVVLSASLRMRFIFLIAGETEAWGGQHRHFLRVC